MLDRIVASKVEAANGVFIDNAWRPGITGRVIPVYAPAEGMVFAEIAAGGAEDVDRAAAAARRAVEAGAWGRMAAFERGRILARIARKIDESAEELARLEARG